MAFEPPPHGVNEIDSAIEKLVLTLKKYGRLTEASEYEAKLLISQLRRERLRAQTAMARTRALLAEMELHVVQTHLNTMKNQSESDERSAPNHERLITLPVNHQQNKASESKSSKTDSGRSSLHKLDKKSLKITKPSCKNCLKLQKKKLHTIETPKSPNESEPQSIPSDANKNATVNNAVPEASKSFKEGDTIDVIPPSKDKAEVKRSNNAVIPKTKNEGPKTTPTVGTSPIAKKIFGIANYNVGQHKNTENSGKESRRMLQEIAKRTSTPKVISKNKANQAKKAAKTSLSIISRKDKAVVPKKLATVTELVARGTVKEQTVKEIPSLRISLPLSSKLNSKVEKVRKSLFGVTKQHCSAEDKIPSKAAPTVGNNKKEKEIQISHHKKTESRHNSNVAPQEKIETKVHGDKVMRRRGKENKKPKSSPAVGLSMPLTECNLANFNRNNAFEEPQETAQERTTQVADHNLKKTQSLKISVPLKNYLSYKEAELEKNKKKQEFLERQTGRRVAWKTINWDAWEAQKKKEEYTRQEADRRPNYTFVKDGPMRKVSWEEFTRGLSLNRGTNELSQSPSAKKTCVKPTTNIENVENTTAHVRTNEDLEVTSAENEGRREVTESEVDKEATNAIFKQIIVKKEMNTSNADDSRSISSNVTALLCTKCECLHESKECPNMKYFKFLGIENIKTEI